MDILNDIHAGRVELVCLGATAKNPAFVPLRDPRRVAVSNEYVRNAQVQNSANAPGLMDLTDESIAEIRALAGYSIRNYGYEWLNPTALLAWMKGEAKDQIERDPKAVAGGK